MNVLIGKQSDWDVGSQHIISCSAVGCEGCLDILLSSPLHSLVYHLTCLYCRSLSCDLCSGCASHSLSVLCSTLYFSMCFFLIADCRRLGVDELSLLSVILFSVYLIFVWLAPSIFSVYCH